MLTLVIIPTKGQRLPDNSNAKFRTWVAGLQAACFNCGLEFANAKKVGLWAEPRP